jgi:hypothetical protein
MKKIFLVLLVSVTAFIVGCGASKNNDSTNLHEVTLIEDNVETVGSITKFNSKSNPRVSYIQHSQYYDMEHLIIISDVTVNLRGYSLANIGSRHFNYTFYENDNININSSYQFTSKSHSNTPIWPKGISYLVFKDPSGNIIQKAKF